MQVNPIFAIWNRFNGFVKSKIYASVTPRMSYHQVHARSVAKICLRKVIFLLKIIHFWLR